ncbi:glycerol-3-phosphate ABC transporter permease protein [Ligilactobacillus salitolerans]|uniref:Glycerol-3-phosphate ABC transporter permease protein n=1 Tax=Ligilactobacillus salitolerans TaxID=1808352 RepID=A0A401IQU1_9LACO|nr:carbohydrate ABC transporter permease [Ligilactobacillus salitolerans]GBG93864.1 glycerol-3-phosphate ABC transporter permease protein [Ligilactobacillus salitolerans]
MKTKQNSVSKWTSFIFLLLLAIIWVVPLLYGVMSSFKSNIEMQSVGFRFLPINWILTNYSRLLQNTSNTPVFRWFLNSLVIAGGSTILVLVVTSLSAFAFSRLRFKGRNTLFYFLLSTMMFPAVMNIIPLYKIMTFLGWANTPWAMIFPAATGALNIFLVRQFMDNIPLAYDEAARIDGASDWQIFHIVILPLVKPVLYVVALFTFTGSWNDFLWPSIVFSDINRMPITPGLKLLQGMYVADIPTLMAGAIIAIIPTFILYLVAQKYFLQSMSLSVGVKG